jgi:lipoprotein-anchoring transpeptidase ErfK/SrfK
MVAAKREAAMRKALKIARFCFLFAICAAPLRMFGSTSVLVSVPEQKLVVFENGQRVAQFPVSTSKFGLGDRPSSYATPLGILQVAAKVGAGAPQGAVFKGQRFTGEVLKPNAPGRDPIVTRILHLRGLEAGNARAFNRGIYIHGTPEERKIGRPASYGCIRMRSKDVVRVFDAVPVGTKIAIVNTSISRGVIQLALAEHGTHHVASN